MNCRECTEFLIDYLEGTLPEGEAAAFEEHLRRCPPCIDYLESYKRCIEMGKTCMECKEEMKDEAPEHLINAILQARKKA